MDEPFFAFDLATGSSEDAARTRRWSSSKPIKPSVNLRPMQTTSSGGRSETTVKGSHSPSKHASSKYEEETDHYMVPKLCGTRLWRIITYQRSCGDYGSDGILDERNSQYGLDVQREEGGEENPH